MRLNRLKNNLRSSLFVVILKCEYISTQYISGEENKVVAKLVAADITNAKGLHELSKNVSKKNWEIVLNSNNQSNGQQIFDF